MSQTQRAKAGAAPSRATVSQAFKLFCIAYLVSGVVALALGSYYSSGTHDSIITFTVTDSSLRYYIFVGAYMMLTAGVGMFASLAPRQRRRLLNAYVGLIALVTFINLCVALWLWIRTLDIRGIYGDNWRHLWSDYIKTSLQENYGCCGYLSPSDSPASSPACNNSKLRYGCKYYIIFYVQRCHRYIYAGLVIFMLFGLGAITTGTLLIMKCDEQDRAVISQYHHFRKRAESNARDTETESTHSSLVVTNYARRQN
ncbi:hypothetical protein GGI25_002163 [Coemansia spiralis]|uniref:Uncharacterized protein n=2 Tax=Coemansia TaxID=4863 RepID=A0A9W8G8B0_9FUNG|nr:Tetraspanin family-domain-containing protein [Coemansia spiralis]KAJ1996172.1 hypothetical protein EDC05_000062 [Coemansia umbellata]KAJ2626071.1 hypothetical protein GGI26_000155 [Coemansia sp. RSA 1358]KAJ2678575.1 hypothetical protein GGI25_002163 [Coemansia spiralis]